MCVCVCKTQYVRFYHMRDYVRLYIVKFIPQSIIHFVHKLSESIVIFLLVNNFDSQHWIEIRNENNFMKTDFKCVRSVESARVQRAYLRIYNKEQTVIRDKTYLYALIPMLSDGRMESRRNVSFARSVWVNDVRNPIVMYSLSHNFLRIIIIIHNMKMIKNRNTKWAKPYPYN